MRRPIVIGGVLASCLAFTLGIIAISGASAQSGVQSAPEVVPTLAGVEQIALHAAAVDGDASPTGMEAASTTEGQAATLLSPEQEAGTVIDPRTNAPFTQTPVFVVTMHGQFTQNRRRMHRPAHAKAAAVPSYAALNLIIDAKSGFVISMIPSNAAVAVGQTGAAQRLG